MKNHFNKLILSIQGAPMEANFLAALFCYIFLIGGLYYFVINKVKSFNIVHILILSIPFGAAVYGTYDFTNATVLKGWGFATAFMDLGWGIFLSSITSIIVVFIRSRMFSNEDESLAGNSRDS